MKDSIEYLSWRFNYEHDKDKNQWLKSVEDYIIHLETTINTLQGELELCCVEPIEFSAEDVAKECYGIINSSAKYKSLFICSDEEVVVDMEKRLLDLL